MKQKELSGIKIRKMLLDLVASINDDDLFAAEMDRDVTPELQSQLFFGIITDGVVMRAGMIRSGKEEAWS